MADPDRTGDPQQQRQPEQLETIPKQMPNTSGLKKVPPYWYPYTTMAKERWLGRELLEVVSTEFRDRSMEYYRYALESGVTTVNGRVARPDTILRSGDRIENVVHRHEPPVTSTPVQILLHDKERQFIVVNKPGSIPVHASGRYYQNSLAEILQNEFGFEKVYTVNRLDRLTSGLLILPLTPDRARELSAEFMAGTVQKEYVARCKGKFPEEEIVCEEPLLTVDRQMGLNIVHPEGKPAKTIFNLIRYDAHTNSSVVRCRPITGRSHQIRVHLQYLGHSIANDSIYSETRIWGPNLGKGGIDIIPSDERTAPAPPDHLKDSVQNTERITPPIAPDLVESTATPASSDPSSRSSTPTPISQPKPKLLPRETGHDIGMGSPVPLSAEAVQVITRLRNMKDEDEDWGRWRDVVFKAKGRLTPVGVVQRKLPPPHRRERGGPYAGKKKMKKQKGQPESDEERAVPPTTTSTASTTPITQDPTQYENPKAEASTTADSPGTGTETAQLGQPEQLTPAEVLSKLPSLSDSLSEETREKLEKTEDGALYCSECYLPLHPDPKPERLYIFLHAKKYTTSLGTFETPMPEWADENWVWEQD